MRGETTVGKIIAETTEAIWECLQPTYLPVPSLELWKNIAARYDLLWQLPHCLGSIDGKHIRIKKFNNTGSRNFNYKGFFSIQLLACADADGCFITVDIGDLGRNSDRGVFRLSRLGRWLEIGEMDVPQSEPLPHDNEGPNFPYYFCGDEAFPLKSYLLRPYPQKTLNDQKRIFNYRLSRGRKSVECAFGMMVSKFRVFETPIACSESTVISIVKCACALHNYIRKTEGKLYESQNMNSQDEINIPQHLKTTQHQQAVHNLSTTSSVREYLSSYFLRPEVSLPWQWKYAVEPNI